MLFVWIFVLVLSNLCSYIHWWHFPNFFFIISVRWEFFLNKGVYVIHYIYWLYLHKKTWCRIIFFLVFFKNLVRAQDQVTHHHQVPWECHLEWVCTLVCHPIMASAVSVNILVKLKDMCMIKFFLDLINHSLLHTSRCAPLLSPAHLPLCMLVSTHTHMHLFI